MDEKFIALLDAVMAQIEDDIKERDFTALQELLVYCPVDALKQYLPEETLTELENSNA